MDRMEEMNLLIQEADQAADRESSQDLRKKIKKKAVRHYVGIGAGCLGATAALILTVGIIVKVVPGISEPGSSSGTNVPAESSLRAGSSSTDGELWHFADDGKLVIDCNPEELVGAIENLPENVVYTGPIGEISWEYDGNEELLTINGDGDMPEDAKYSAYRVIWGYYSKLMVQEGISSIASGAFADQDFLEYVELPESLKRIGSYSFAQDTLLKEVYIPNQVETIGERAFRNCTNLRFVHLPKNLSSIGADAFDGLVALKLLTVPTNAKGFDVNSLPVSSGDKVFLYYYGTEEQWKEAYGEFAPDEKHLNYQVIYDADSYQWDDMKRVANGNVEFIYEINEEGECIVKEYQGSDSHIVLPDYIDDYPVTDFTLEDEVFTEITLPAHFKEFFGGYHFLFDSLEKIYVSDANEIYTSVDGVLYSKDGTTLVRVPPAYPEKSFDIPDSVTEIAFEAFNGCRNIEEIRFPINHEVKIDMYWCFSGCNIKTLTIPKNVHADCWGAFGGLSDLKEIHFESTQPMCLTTMMFNGNSSMEKLYFNGDILSIEEDTFEGCTALTDIYFNSSSGNANVFMDISLPGVNLHPDYSVEGGSGETQGGEIKKDTFNNLVYIPRPDGTCLLDDWLGDDSNMEYYSRLGDAGESFRVSGFTEHFITERAPKIKKITFKDCLRYLNENPFGNDLSWNNLDYFCNLEAFDVDHGENSYFVVRDGVLYEDGGLCLLRVPPCKTGDFIVPDSVQEITRKAFYNSSLSSISFSDNNIVITGDSVFENCKKIVTLDFPSNVRFDYGYDRFKGMSSLTEISIGSPDGYLSNSCFCDCTNLRKITLEGDFLYSPCGDFNGCEGTVNIYYNTYSSNYMDVAMYSQEDNIILHPFTKLAPEYSFTPKQILEEPFDLLAKSGLKWEIDGEGTLHLSGNGAIPYPENIDYGEVGYSIYGVENWRYDTWTPWIKAMENGTTIKKIVVEEGVTGLAPCCFAEMPDVTEVELPSTLKEIPPYAFAGSDSLKSVKFATTEGLVIDATAFEQCPDQLLDQIRKTGCMKEGVAPHFEYWD